MAAYLDTTANRGKFCVHHNDVPEVAQAAGLQVLGKKKMAGRLLTMLELTRWVG
jgi:hypothetical protein